MAMKTQPSKSIGCCKSSAESEVHSNVGLLQKRRKISNQQLNLLPKRIRKRQTKPKIRRRKENTKIRRGTDSQKQQKKINKIKSWFFETKLTNLWPNSSRRRKKELIK